MALATLKRKPKHSLPPLPGSNRPRFPINNARDVEKAVRAIGRTKGGPVQRAKVRRYVTGAAAKIGASHKIPPTWRKGGKLDMAVIGQLVDLAQERGLTQVVDLAKPGQRYRHGWIPINPGSSRKVAGDYTHHRGSSSHAMYVEHGSAPIGEVHRAVAHPGGPTTHFVATHSYTKGPLPKITRHDTEAEAVGAIQSGHGGSARTKPGKKSKNKPYISVATGRPAETHAAPPFRPNTPAEQAVADRGKQARTLAGQSRRLDLQRQAAIGRGDHAEGARLAKLLQAVEEKRRRLRSGK